MTTITKINVYRSGTEWFYAAFGADGHDHNDEIGIPATAPASLAIATMAARYEGAEIKRVSDVDRHGNPVA